MLIRSLAEHLEDLGGDAGVGAHAGADDRDLADPLVGADPWLRRRRARRSCRWRSVRSERSTVKERSASCVVADRLVLDDHVDVDVGVGQRGEDPAGDAGLVADAGQRHAGLVVGVGHGGYERLLHGLVLCDDEGTGAVLEAAAAVDADTVVARVLDRAQLQDPGPGGRHLEHLLVGDMGQLAGVGDDPRVGAEDAGDVGVDLADAGVEGGGERDRGRVGAAPPQRGDVAAVGGDALEAGDEDDPVLLERLADAVGADVDDPRLRVGGVGDDPGLGAGQRDRLVAHVVDRHRAERAGDPLAGREQHVHLAGHRAARRSPAPGRPARRSSCPAPRARRRPGCRPRGRRRSGRRRA